LLLAQSAVAGEFAMVGREDDQRVAYSSVRFERVEYPSRVVVDLRDQAHIRGPHVADDLFAREALAFVMLAIRMHDGMLVGGAVLRPAPNRTDILLAIELVKRRRREIRPMRLDVGE